MTFSPAYSTARSAAAMLLACAVFAGASFARPGAASQPHPMNAGELRLELKKLSVLGSVLYVSAHPDDENTNLLAYLSKGRLVRAGYLSVTRGEGGQNLIGREQGAAMGVIRTEELLAARRIDGAEQFFTRAIDFGYSKSSAEALRFWGQDEIVSDVVRVIRSFRPDVIVTRFSDTLGGHGHHTASAILAREAFELAGDSSYLPAVSGGQAPWKARRLLFNAFRFAGLDTAAALKLNIGGYNPLLGESYNEISGRSRSMHKSQGFGAAQNRGDVINYFLHTAGDSAKADIMDGIDLSWQRVPGAEQVARTLADAERRLDPENPSGILPLLLRAWSELGRLGDDPWVEVKKDALREVILAAAGVHLEAVASVETASPGDTLTVRTTAINRSGFPFTIKSIRSAFSHGDSLIGSPLRENAIFRANFRVEVPATEPYSTQDWLARPPQGYRYDIADPTTAGRPGVTPPYSVVFTLAAGGELLEVEVPLLHRSIDPVEGDVYRTFIVSPPVSIVPEEKVLLFPSGAAGKLNVRVTSMGGGTAGTLVVKTPAGWTSSPPALPFRLRAGNPEERFTFTITPSPGAAAGEFTVSADLGGRTVGTGTTTIRYPHIPAQSIFTAASGRLVPADVVRRKFTVGYIEGSGDDVPEALRQIGYDVVLLGDDDLLSGDLAHFQAIVAGVRSYNTREVLAMAQKRLMEYVSGGGTYIVQYVTNGTAETGAIGPYPLNISRERVSDETAPVTLLAPEHPALSFPNRIGEADFAGWVQERGLYFADRWDSAYTPLISSGDPGEPAREGGLLAARYGEGYYCYTGLAFFRQLPAGVPGAYRLFANLVELGSGGKARGGR